MVRELTISVPCLRIMHTRRASPKLASHAPKVNKIIHRKVSNSLVVPNKKAIERARVRIIPSRANSVISKCLRWIITVIIVAAVRAGKKDRKEFMFIDRRI